MQNHPAGQIQEKHDLLSSHLEYLGRLPAREVILDSKMRLCFF